MSDTTPAPPPASPPPAPPPAPSTGGFGDSGGYPVRLDLERGYDEQNWRPLVNWLLAIPQWIVLIALGFVAGVLQIVSFFTVLFTRRNPFLGFQTMWLRYTWRVTSFALFMRNDYPPFDFATEPSAVVSDSSVVEVDDPGEMNRWLPLVKWLLAIPHFIVLSLLSIAAFFVAIVAFFAVLFTGKWPEGMRDFVVGFQRWVTRVTAYVYFLTDEYPPFSLQ
jgi:roadblock/LC7 domain-containing protein